MIHLVSQGAQKAEVIVSEPDGQRRTVHLLHQRGKWFDKHGTAYDLQSGKVDFFLYYRNRLEHYIRSQELEEWAPLAVKVVHEYHKQYPETETGVGVGQ